MKLAMLGFTRAGTGLCRLLADGLSAKGYCCLRYALEKYLGEDEGAAGFLPVGDDLRLWTKEQFALCDGLLFIGAAGIAVRLIAPFIEDKRRDPAVVIVDEAGGFAISLLSGHLGGANSLAKAVSEVTGGVCVITTATDVNGRFAVDLYAKENGLWIDDMKLAKDISADILDGKPVGFFHDYITMTSVPDGLCPEITCERNIRVTALKAVREEPGQPDTLRLIPPVTVIGIGCRKGTSESSIMNMIETSLKKAGLSIKSLAAIGTIELKAEEAGLVSCARNLGVPLIAFTREELEEQPGDFTFSEFVLKTTGVGNVCERAALAVCNLDGGGSLVLKKQSEHGVTAAVAIKEWKAAT